MTYDSDGQAYRENLGVSSSSVWHLASREFTGSPNRVKNNLFVVTIYTFVREPPIGKVGANRRFCVD